MTLGGLLDVFSMLTNINHSELISNLKISELCLNPNLKHSELMPKLNLKHVEI